MTARILIVEDEAVIARDIRVTLQHLGYDVGRPATSGALALEAVADTTPDLVLMDIHLQGDLDGIETAQRIRDRYDTPVIYLTSYSDDATVERAKATGAYGYILKPFSERDLRTAIEVALQKREIEQRLVERERWFATTLRSIGDAVIATDAAQRITFMNAVAERLTGWTFERASGRLLSDVLNLVHSQTGAPIDSPLTRALDEGFAVVLPSDVSLSLSNGERRAIADSAAPIIDDKGKLLGGVVVFSDITERKRLEERLAQQERLAAIGTLSAGMAHEINNPLAYVLSNVTFVTEALPELRDQLRALGGEIATSIATRLDELSEALDEAVEGSKRVHRIVHDLKKFGRLEKPDSTVLELGAVIDSAVRLTEGVTRARARVRCEYGITPFVLANEGQLGQVFTNLIINAAQAIGETDPRAHEIAIVTLTDDAGRAVVEVRDTGPGIPAEVQRRIFDPFFTTKAVGQGSGLGLAISHSIVASLGGELSVESVVGKGTTMRVALPPTTMVPVVEVTRLDIKTRRGQVLVIDDEPSIGRATTRALKRDHDVFVVTDARMALSQIAGGERFDVILCDLMMPGMTGMEFYEALSKANPELVRRIVFVTGGAISGRTQEFLDATPNTTLEKPVETTTLRRIVAEYVAR